MTRNPLVIDLGIAVLCVLVVLIISPGVAVDAIVALIVLTACGASFALARRRRRGGRSRPRRSISGYTAGQDDPRPVKRPGR